MAIEYQSVVIGKYRDMLRAGVLSSNLMSPSPGNLKRECLLVFYTRYMESDNAILKNFFMPYDERIDLDRMMKIFDIDRFRPLANYLRGRIDKTEIKNIDLLAWLIDFQPRPYGAFHTSKPGTGIIQPSNVKITGRMQSPQETLQEIKKLNNNTFNNAVKKVSSLELQHMESQENITVFVSYGWDNEDHKEKVISFTDHLRINGFNASLDRMHTQKETAINFVKMMHVQMSKHQKVIVVLSTGYKQKADSFTGGVGEEYQLLLNDINNSPKKYILVSLEGRSDDIVPFGLKGREILDLSLRGNMDALYRKLLDEELYAFSPVSPKRPKLEPKKIAAFDLMAPLFPLAVERPTILLIGNSKQGGKYRTIDFQLRLNFKNQSKESVNGLAYQMRLLSNLLPNPHEFAVGGGYSLLRETLGEKIFPNQTVSGKAFEIKFSNATQKQIFDSEIFVTIYTDQGHSDHVFIVSELFRIVSVGQDVAPGKPLSKDLFI